MGRPTGLGREGVPVSLSHTNGQPRQFRQASVFRGGERVDRTLFHRHQRHVCSCCLELFQVLGREHRKKLVMPCPGAVLFGRLEPNRFLLAERG